MTESVQIAIIVAIGPTLAGIAAVVVSVLNGKKIQDVHLSTNSRLDQLLKVTKSVAHAEGMADQRAADAGKKSKPADKARKAK